MSSARKINALRGIGIRAAIWYNDPIMRTIPAQAVSDAVARLLVQACIELPPDVEAALARCRAREQNPLAQDTLQTILDNAAIAKQKRLPICQDTGVAVVFAELGAEVHVTDGFIIDAINDGIRAGARAGWLRASIVRDPLQRDNTGDNAPGVVFVLPVPGDTLRLTVAPKGAGCENMSRTAMLKPGAGAAAIKEFVVATVSAAGGNACPPVVIGVGIGGDFALSALLAKKALLRTIGARHPDPLYSALEVELLDAVNATGIGPMGYGGAATALEVFIERAPCHIASLPVSVCLNCHAARHASATL